MQPTLTGYVTENQVNKKEKVYSLLDFMMFVKSLRLVKYGCCENMAVIVGG